jgi:hypothetical protein
VNNDSTVQSKLYNEVININNNLFHVNNKIYINFDMRTSASNLKFWEEKFIYLLRLILYEKSFVQKSIDRFVINIEKKKRKGLHLHLS